MRKAMIPVQGALHEIVKRSLDGRTYILGICCGCNQWDQLLSQVSPDRWRCDACAVKETA